jgi:hypothetical protein
MLNGIAAIGYSEGNGAVIRGTGAAQPLPVAASPGWGPDAIDVTGLTVSEAIERVDEARILELRERIAAGTYLTDHKLDVVADRLAEVLHQPVAASAER